MRCRDQGDSEETTIVRARAVQFLAQEPFGVLAYWEGREKDPEVCTSACLWLSREEESPSLISRLSPCPPWL